MSKYLRWLKYHPLRNMARFGVATPTNADLPDGFWHIKYTAGGNAVLYVNDGGVIKSFTLGTAIGEDEPSLLHLPCVGWTETLSGSGNSIVHPGCIELFTGGNAGSYALRYCYMYGLSIGVHPEKINFDKKLILVFNIARANSNAAITTRVQLKTVETIGSLTAKGIGLRIINYTLLGESYGTEYGSVDLVTVLNDVEVAQIIIIHDPTVPKIEWWVRSAAGGTLTLKGTQTTAAKIPSGLSTGFPYLVISIDNHTTAFSAEAWFSQPKFWQSP